MNDFNTLLTDVQSRNSRTGIITADRYFRDVQNCFDGGFCPVKNVGIASAEQWQKALKDAERKLTYCGGRRPIKDSFRKSKNSDSIMEFDAIITTTKRDRDGDVLESRGANIDKQAPLLCQHVPMMLIGKFIRTVKRTDSFVKGHFGIADTELGHDYAKLAKYGALRISHGFMPKDNGFEPMEDEQGWHFTKFDIFEVSLVSVPSNVDAVITSVSKHKWASPLVKGWAERLKPKTQVSVPVGITKQPPPIVQPGDPITAEGWNTLVRQIETLAEAKACECSKSKDEKFVFDNPADHAISREEIRELLAKRFAETPEPEPRTLESIETEYIAALAKADIETVRESARLVSLRLRSAEEREEARLVEKNNNEWNEFFHSLT